MYKYLNIKIDDNNSNNKKVGGKMTELKSAFVNTFGDSPTVRVLDFFLTFDSFDYSKSQVAKEAGISRITIENIWKDLVKNSIIIKNRNVGRAEMYHLNKENPKVKALMELDFKLSSALADKEIGVASKIHKHMPENLAL